MPGAPSYKRKTSVDFKVCIFGFHFVAIVRKFQGLSRFIKKYNKELEYYIKVHSPQKNVNFSCFIFLQDTFSDVGA